MKSFERVRLIKGRRFLFKVENSASSPQYLKYDDLRNKVWGDPEDRLAGGRNMMCENYLHDGGSLYIGVFAESVRGGFVQDPEHLVGFCYGFAGVKDKKVGFREPKNVQFYSQYTGVREDFQGWGLGRRIKEFQRDQVLNLMGIGTITCTYDPLTSVNAYRNVHRFGMKVLEYVESAYSDFAGFLNRPDIPRDRLYVSWDLRKQAGTPGFDRKGAYAPEHRVIVARPAEVSGKSGPIRLEVVEELRLDHRAEVLTLDVPLDFYGMLRETDVRDESVRNIPLEWRLRTRQAFLSLFGAGYRIIDFCFGKGREQRSFYVLRKATTRLLRGGRT
jgi:predicted GNAT superfamily acetyltransferase